MVAFISWKHHVSVRNGHILVSSYISKAIMILIAWRVMMAINAGAHSTLYFTYIQEFIYRSLRIKKLVVKRQLLRQVWNETLRNWMEGRNLAFVWISCGVARCIIWRTCLSVQLNFLTFIRNSERYTKSILRTVEINQLLSSRIILSSSIIAELTVFAHLEFLKFCLYTPSP